MYQLWQDSDMWKRDTSGRRIEESSHHQVLPKEHLGSDLTLTLPQQVIQIGTGMRPAKDLQRHGLLEWNLGVWLCMMTEKMKKGTGKRYSSGPR